MGYWKYIEDNKNSSTFKEKISLKESLGIVQDIASYIILREHEEGRCLSNFRLQKLLYFSQAKSFSVLGKECFNVVMEEWGFGPVIPVVYNRYKIFGSGDIPCSVITEQHSDDIPLDKEIKKIVDSACDVCSHYTTPSLNQIVYNQTPWIKAHRYNTDITLSMMKEYFCK